MGTKNNPGKFDCYANAEPDEPMFVLLARDEQSPSRVRDWARKYIEKKRSLQGGMMSFEQFEKYREAMDCAKDMEAWRKENRG